MQTKTNHDAPGTCPRTFMIYKPGEFMPGVHHHFYWNGEMPCTGSLVCSGCGQRAPEAPITSPITAAEISTLWGPLPTQLAHSIIDAALDTGERDPIEYWTRDFSAYVRGGTREGPGRRLRDAVARLGGRHTFAARCARWCDLTTRLYSIPAAERAEVPLLERLLDAMERDVHLATPEGRALLAAMDAARTEREEADRG